MPRRLKLRGIFGIMLFMKIVVIGGGAAGLMAAISAAKEGSDVTILEKNEKLGKKIYITGKGRCNITNACDSEDFFKSVARNSKFMFSSFRLWSNEDMISFLEENGLSLKEERGKRIFPKSDKASDVTRTLENIARRLDVNIKLNTEVKEILFEEAEGEGTTKKCIGVRAREFGSRIDYLADAVIIATGGVSYPTTGSTGDGYEFAKSAGHEVTDRSPSLVGFNASLVKKCGENETTIPSEISISELAGLSLKNVRASLYDGTKQIASEFGEMLFTHTGVSGPIIITLSSIISGKFEIEKLKLFIDLKPALTVEELDARLLREFDEAKNKRIRNVMRKLLPESLIDAVLAYAEIDRSVPIHEITRENRRSIIDALKKFEIKPSSLGGFNEAIITRGGVSVKEINPATMESKKVNGLFFAGEVIDIDAFTGGFNLQLAWSTGYAAGKGAVK